jgi:hypothetical protein
MMIDLPTVYETFKQSYKHDSVRLPTNMLLSLNLMQSMYKPNNSSGVPSEENTPQSLDLPQNVSNPNMDSSTPAQAILPLSPVLMQNVAGQNNDSI